MTRMQIVVDASVALALVQDEQDSGTIRATVASWLLQDVELVVPDHFWLEVVNPLARRHRWDSGRLLEALRDLDDLPVTTIGTARPQLLLALTLMDEYALTAYDAVYLALAETISARLATTDEVLLGAAGDLGLDPRLGPRHRPGRTLAEVPTSYGSSARSAGERPVTWPTWPGAGPYLATLRRRALAEEDDPKRTLRTR
ncbi:MAG: type II toxin-antitoxin system VapC family toxin [Candidatus Limnocylindrales bacterium]